MKEQPLRLKYLKLLSLLLLAHLSYSQDTISITDDSGEALVGVQLYSDDYQINGISNPDGLIILNKAWPDTLQVNLSYAGYQSLRGRIADLRKARKIVLASGMLLDEVVLIGRTNTSSKELINTISTIKQRDLQVTNPQTTADAIGQHSDVYIQKSQMGGGSPIVRGFEANKILLVVDGVRMNNAIYRSGHLQNAITIDPQILERIEVIYGPGSLMYGSDALGGVLHFRSRDPKLNFDSGIRSSGSLMSRYASANGEKTIHGNVEIAGSHIASLTSLSYSDFGDLKSGTRSRPAKYPDFGQRYIYADRQNGSDLIVFNPDPAVQIGTAYQQLDVLQKIKLKVNNKTNVVANVQFSTSSDVPRYDQLQEADDVSLLRYAEWNYGPQTRFLGSLRLSSRTSTPLYDQVIAIASFQSINEDRIVRRLGRNNRETQEERVHVYGWTLDMNKSLNNVTIINYGVDFNYNTLRSVAYSTDITSGVNTADILSRYPDGNNHTRQIAAYAMARRNLSDQHHITAGIRYNLNRVALQYSRTDIIAWPSTFTDGLINDNQALTGSLGYKYTAEDLTIRSMVATAFRAPNIDDIAKIRVNNGEVSIPNLDLQPEKSLSTELSVSKTFDKKHQIAATAYYTQISDAIVRSRGSLPDGSEFIVDGGDSLATFINTNATEAYVYGISLNFQSQITDHLRIAGSYNYLKGQQNDEGAERPLSHIPPAYGQASANYQIKPTSNIRFVTRFNAAKDISDYGDSTDNPDLATAEGSLSWYTMNLYADHKINDHLTVNAGVENILDRFYRPFASGVNGSGRNFIISLRAQF